MSDEQFSENTKNRFKQVIPIDLERLRLVKISTLSGDIHIRGTKEPNISVWSGNRDFTPSVEIKGGGSEVQIIALPGNNVNFNFAFHSREYDPDIATQEPEGDFDAGDESAGWHV